MGEDRAYPGRVQMFKDRMTREGRGEEYVMLYKRFKEEGSQHAPAMNQVHREMGYAGLNEEKKLYDEMMDGIEGRGLEMSIDFVELNEAIMALPPNADSYDEIQWIAAHPAMRDEEPKIDAKAILDPPAGPAPSQACCNALINLNREKFWEKWMTDGMKQKPSVEEEKEKEFKDPGLDRAAEMLKELE